MTENAREKMNLNDYIKLTLGVNIRITKAKIKKKNQNDLIKLALCIKIQSLSFFNVET